MRLREHVWLIRWAVLPARRYNFKIKLPMDDRENSSKLEVQVK